VLHFHPRLGFPSCLLSVFSTQNLFTFIVSTTPATCPAHFSPVSSSNRSAPHYTVSPPPISCYPTPLGPLSSSAPCSLKPAPYSTLNVTNQVPPLPDKKRGPNIITNSWQRGKQKMQALCDRPVLGIEFCWLVY
jgi:hypothetical protein